MKSKPQLWVTSRVDVMNIFAVSVTDVLKKPHLHVWYMQERLCSFTYWLIANDFAAKFTEKPKIDGKQKARIKIVSNKNKSTESSSGKVGDWNGIANVAFTKADKDALFQWLKTIEIADLLHDIVASDYKVSLSWDNRNDAFTCSVSCYNSKEPNYKYTMISRAPDPISAMQVAIYKHVVLSEGDWGQSRDEEVWG